jgi:hypothetical protein
MTGGGLPAMAGALGPFSSADGAPGALGRHQEAHLLNTCVARNLGPLCSPAHLHPARVQEGPEAETESDISCPELEISICFQWLKRK